MNKTSIEWVKNPDGSQGYTWNPITGCLNHRDGLCRGGGFPCYAYRLANTRLRERYLANKNTATDNYDEDSYPFYPRLWPDKTMQPWPPKGKPKGYFVCDMSDLFGIGVPEKWTAEVMRTIEACENDRFYLLTKQPQNLAKWSPFPDNCWVGASVCNEVMYLKACKELHDVKASIKFLSFEPLLEELHKGGELLEHAGIGWEIIGAQTKPKKMPGWDWVKDIINAADDAGIPVFLKDNLGLLKWSCEGAMPFYKKDTTSTMQLRQELPRMEVVV